MEQMQFESAGAQAFLDFTKQRAALIQFLKQDFDIDPANSFQGFPPALDQESFRPLDIDFQQVNVVDLFADKQIIQAQGQGLLTIGTSPVKEFVCPVIAVQGSNGH